MLGQKRLTVRRGRYRVECYAAEKTLLEQQLRAVIAGARIRPYDGPVEIGFAWQDCGRTLDPDNQRAGAKLILDSLVAEGVIATDSRVWVRALRDVYPRGPAGVLVMMRRRRRASSSTTSPATPGGSGRERSDHEVGVLADPRRRDRHAPRAGGRRGRGAARSGHQAGAGGGPERSPVAGTAIAGTRLHLLRMSDAAGPAARREDGETVSDWYGDVIRKLAELAALEADWDGEGAAATDPAVVADAEILADWLARRHLPRPSIVPCRDGCLQFEWNAGDDGIELDLDGHGSCSLFIWRSAGANGIRAIRRDGVGEPLSEVLARELPRFARAPVPEAGGVASVVPSRVYVRYWLSWDGGRLEAQLVAAEDGRPLSAVESAPVTDGCARLELHGHALSVDWSGSVPVVRVSIQRPDAD
jgi:hypothetical protein